MLFINLSHDTTNQTTMLTQAAPAWRCIGRNFAKESSLCGSRTWSTLHRRNKVSKKNLSDSLSVPGVHFISYFFKYTYILCSFLSSVPVVCLYNINIHILYSYDFDSLFHSLCYNRGTFFVRLQVLFPFIVGSFLSLSARENNKNLFTATNIWTGSIEFKIRYIYT